MPVSRRRAGAVLQEIQRPGGAAARAGILAISVRERPGKGAVMVLHDGQGDGPQREAGAAFQVAVGDERAAGPCR